MAVPWRSVRIFQQYIDFDHPDLREVHVALAEGEEPHAGDRIHVEGQGWEVVSVHRLLATNHLVEHEVAWLLSIRRSDADASGGAGIPSPGWPPTLNEGATAMPEGDAPQSNDP